MSIDTVEFPGAAARTPPRDATQTILFGAFFLSGFSALVNQTAWQRMLGLFAGSDAVAATVVVGAFLFGLGIGSLIGGIIADRLSERRALLAFAACEIGIGLFALTSRFLFYDLLFGRLGALAASPAAVAGAVLAALFVPTALMGLSLPLLSRAVVQKLETAAAEIGFLYGLNTFGGAAGALLAGLLFLGTLGYDLTVDIAAAVSLLVGLVAVIAAWRVQPNATRTSRKTHRTAPHPFVNHRRLVVWGVVALTSGFFIISLEMVWLRLVGALMQSDAYAFATILAAFLVADGIGMAIGAQLVRGTVAPARIFLALQGGAALYALASIGVLYWLHSEAGLARFFIAAPTHVHTLLDKLERLIAFGSATGILVMPPALLLGMSFPIIQKAVQSDLSQVGWRVGVIQLCNIVGNAAGALITGLVLLHWLGTAGTLRLIGGVGLAFAVAWLWHSGRRGGAPVALIAMLAILIAGFPDNHRFWSRLHDANADSALSGEDRTAVVVLRPWETGHASFVGGRWQNYMLPAMPTTAGLGIIGPLLHPEPVSALLVGHGAGITLDMMGVRPETRRLHAVEIARPVLDTVHEFVYRHRAAALMALFTDPRIERTVADGRHVLFTQSERYDLIVAVAISPHTSHSGLLYSREFFELARSRLANGGLFVQWAATPRTVATFTLVFPHVVRAGGALIGSNEPIRFDMDRLESQLRGPYRDRLEALGTTPDAILGWLRSSPLQVWEPTDARQDTDINTDLFPKDEYHLNS